MADEIINDIPGGEYVQGGMEDEGRSFARTSGDFSPPDTVPPVIVNITPVSGSVLDPATNTISFQTTDNKAFGRVIVTALYVSGLSEVVHDSLVFSPNYIASSSRSNLVDGFSYTVSRTGGWLEDFTLYILSIDAEGNIAEATPIYTVPNGPGTGANDSTAPIVSNYNPAPNTTIAQNSSITFDVTDDSGSFCSLMVTAYFADSGEWEVIHTGETFSPRYTGGSGVAVIPNGFRYVVRRTSGWARSPTIIVYAIDAAGNEST